MPTDPPESRVHCVIDLKLAREDPDGVRRSQLSRGEDPGLVDVLLDAAAARGLNSPNL